MILKRALIIALLAAAAPAQAGFYCTGTIAGTYTDSNGYLFASLNAANGNPNGNWFMFCNVGTTWSGINPQTCVSWTATITSAVLTNKPVSVYYDTTSSCTTLPTYSAAPAPYFVMLLP